ncbi:MAG TPA: BatD family protein [Candidatus Omnitrophota bacterium]|nr:BatD family protein [Candidatus Omnitrophota bacterium]
MKRILLISFCCVFTLCPRIFCANEQVKVLPILDKRTVELGDQIQLSIRIVGAQNNLLRPRLPDIEGFDSFFQGRSNQFTFTNGQSESTTTFNYVLVPNRAGSFTLPPIEVEVDNQVFRTDSIALRVTGTQPAQNSGYPPPRSPAGTSGRTSSAGPSPVQSAPAYSAGSPAIPAVNPNVAKASVPLNADQDIFMRVTADKQEAYVNEQILLTYSIFTRYSTRAEQFEKDPNLSGFWVEELPIEKNYQPEKIVLGGLQYLKADVRRLAVFPTTTGVLEIDPGVYRATVRKENRSSSIFDDFFDDSFFGGSIFARRETKLLGANPVKITVRPLPEQDKPEDFTGMVGQFQMEASIDKRSVKQNEPIRMTLFIEGQGNMEMVTRPNIPELPDFKVYDTDSSNQFVKDRQGVRGRKVFEITFIPTSAGDLEIPSMSFNYFDPRQSQYRILKTQPYQIKVSPAPYTPLPDLTGRESGEDLRKTLKLERADIHFIEEGFDPAQGKGRTGTIIRILFAVNVLLTLFSAFFLTRRLIEERLNRDVAFKRSLFARSTLQKGLRGLKKLAHAKSPVEQRKYFDSAAKILNQYFSDKFNLSAQGITIDEIQSRLEEKGFGAEKIERIKAFYHLCDEVRFTSGKIPEIRMGEFLKLTDAVTAFLERK